MKKFLGVPVKKLPGVIISVAVQALFMWIVAIGFMNYGICWRTVLTFGFIVMMRLADKLIGAAVYAEQKETKPAMQTNSEIQ